MDNTVQRPMQQPPSQPTVPQITTVAPVVGDIDTKQIGKPDRTQISAPNLEFGPIASMSPGEMGAQVEEADDDEDEIKVAKQEVMFGTKVTPTQEVPVSQELKDFGVEQGQDTEKEIPVVVQRAGMRAAQADSAVPMSAIETIKLPITYAHAVQLDKRSKIKESIKWLARFIKRQWERVKYMEKHKGEASL